MSVIYGTTPAASSYSLVGDLRVTGSPFFFLYFKHSTLILSLLVSESVDGSLSSLLELLFFLCFLGDFLGDF